MLDHEITKTTGLDPTALDACRSYIESGQPLDRRILREFDDNARAILRELSVNLSSRSEEANSRYMKLCMLACRGGLGRIEFPIDSHTNTTTIQQIGIYLLGGTQDGRSHRAGMNRDEV